MKTIDTQKAIYIYIYRATCKDLYFGVGEVWTRQAVQILFIYHKKTHYVGPSFYLLFISTAY